MSRYTDKFWDTDAKATIDVYDVRREAKVTYPGEEGRTFAVIVRVKPNPIGFRARLPGDAE